MKFTLSWLKDHLETTASLADISKTLTSIGLEVEQIIDRGAALSPFTVAKILAAEKHPEADKLRVCKVLSDVGELQIVCGAPNARAGLMVVLDKEGATIPNGGMVIKKTKIRGVESNGMLCSAEELALPGDSSGIIELPESSQVGQAAADALGLNDPVIEIAITPNRADCLGVYGVARDLAAAGLGPLNEGAGDGCHWSDKEKGNSSDTRHTSPVTVTLETPNCFQFIGCAIKGVENGPSPDWLKKRLEAIGQKSISALVDITNYITFDLGRPLHVYDLSKLSGNLTVRAAKEGEKLKALNGKDYILPAGITVIADQAAPLAIGGIIGGESTGCDNVTTDVFLEVALFDPTSVAKAGRALQIDSDARYRFERGVDVAFVENGAKLAIAMIQKLCGGAASELVLAGKTPQWQRQITFSPERVKTLGGVDLPAEKSYHILSSLGFTINHQPSTINPPSWRADIEGEADLVEEVLRIHGYDTIPHTPLPKPSGVVKPALNTAQKRVHTTKRALASRGMMEVCTWSFIPQAQAEMFGGTNAKLKLLNPISADLDTMRPSLLPNLLEAAKKNQARGFSDLRLFEVGLQYSDITPQGQRMVATGVHVGKTEENHYKNGLFQHGQRPADAFDAKADALHVLETLGLTKCDITTNTPSWYHPGRSGALTLGGKIILGYFGEIHPGVLPGFDVTGSVAAFEIFLDAIPLPRANGYINIAASGGHIYKRFCAAIAEIIGLPGGGARFRIFGR